MATYNRDTEVELQGTFTDANGADVDPTEVTLYVLSPSGTTTTYTLSASEVTRSALGVYTRRVLLDESGDWHYRFKGDGAVKAADWKRLVVLDDPFA